MASARIVPAFLLILAIPPALAQHPCDKGASTRVPSAIEKLKNAEQKSSYFTKQRDFYRSNPCLAPEDMARLEDSSSSLSRVGSPNYMEGLKSGTCEYDTLYVRKADAYAHQVEDSYRLITSLPEVKARLDQCISGNRAEKNYIEKIAGTADKYSAVSPEERARYDKLVGDIASTRKTMDMRMADGSCRGANQALSECRKISSQLHALQSEVKQMSQGAELANCRATNLRKYNEVQAAYNAGVHSKKIVAAEQMSINAMMLGFLTLKNNNGGRDIVQCDNYRQQLDRTKAAVDKAAAS